MLGEWNATEVDHPVTCLHQRLALQAARTPDALAVMAEDQRLTYRELDRWANQVARRLLALGVGPDELVAVCLDRSAALVAALLGVLKAGGAYLPLDPDYPADRLAFMLRDSRARVLLTERRHAGSFPNGGALTLCLDAPGDGLGREPDGAPVTGVTPQHLAYVIYTSGSSGVPKGVAVSHAALCNHLFWVLRAFPLTPEDRVIQKTPFSFDSSLIEFWAPLLAGARLVMARPGAHRDPAYLTRLIADQQATFLLLVPSLLDALVDDPGFADCRSLRIVISAGEPLSVELCDRFHARSGALLSNHYGPTETAIGATYWNCERGDARPLVPIGRPIDNVQVYVVDHQLRPVGLGVPGELCIGGAGVARGYLHRPELTAERFVPDPFRPGGRLYKTGDLARYLPDGSLEFLGRLDQQVKIRGFRIEPGEIEAVLARVSGVRQAVVVAQERPGVARRLVAYVVPARAGLTPGEVRRALVAEVPEHMVPQAFVLLDVLPLLPNGKVDRSALPEPTVRRPDLDQPYAEPRAALERWLADLWREVLDLDRVGLHDRFFELGGDSIQAAVVLNRLRRALGVPIYIVSLFEAPTVAEYAAWLEREYPAAVAQHLGLGGKPATERADRRIDAAAIAAFRERWPLWEPDPGPSLDQRNGPVMFILAPPRSGTTLLRAMLGGHPGLFAADELHLLQFPTLAARRAAYAGPFGLWLEGLVRAVMELRACGADDAKAIIASYEDRGLSTRALYRVLQEWVAPRLLVDKTPAYALDRGALRRAEAEFRQPLYIHLVRHPHAMVRSFEERRMDQVLPIRDHGCSPRELAELVWVTSQQHTMEFLADVPPERQHRLRFEDLAHNPGATMRGLCAALGLTFHPALVDPYGNGARNLTDGIYAVSTSMADPSFRERRAIDPAVADRWQAVAGDDFLGDVTWELAAALGYDRVTGPSLERTERLRRQRERRLGRRSVLAGGPNA